VLLTDESMPFSASFPSLTCNLLNGPQLSSSCEGGARPETKLSCYFLLQSGLQILPARAVRLAHLSASVVAVSLAEVVDWLIGAVPDTRSPAVPSAANLCSMRSVSRETTIDLDDVQNVRASTAGLE
jgi:hypothetical protein